MPPTNETYRLKISLFCGLNFIVSFQHITDKLGRCADFNVSMGFRKLVLINSCKHIDHSVNRGTYAAITIHFTDYWADHSLSFSFLCFSKTMKCFRFKPVESRNGKNFHCKAGPNSSLSIDSISVKEVHHRTFKAGKYDWRLTRLSKRDWSLGHRNDRNNWIPLG